VRRREFFVFDRDDPRRSDEPKTDEDDRVKRRFVGKTRVVTEDSGERNSEAGTRRAVSRRLKFSDAERFKLLRYVVSGVAISTGYTITVLLLVSTFQVMGPVGASTLSFITWTPLSYVVHRDFSFRYNGAQVAAAMKFLVTFAVRLIASAYVVHFSTQVMGWSYLVGVFANWVVLPIINYLVLSLWVFALPLSAEAQRLTK
jgi:putative flippase GtrA